MINPDITKLISRGRDQLKKTSTSALLDVEILLAFVCSVERHQVYHLKKITDVQRHMYDILMAHRACREPIAHLVGSKSFFGLDFEVNASTLIPRFDTEELMELVVSYVNERKDISTCLDVGTGTGAMMIALMAEFSSRAWSAVGVEPPKQARNLAVRNIKKLLPQSLWNQIQILGNLSEINESTFDIVLCNPPYLSFEDWCETESDVHIYEPQTALLADRSLESWIQGLTPYVRKGGRLYMEWGVIPEALREKSVFSSFLSQVGLNYIDNIEYRSKCHFLVIGKNGDHFSCHPEAKPKDLS